MDKQQPVGLRQRTEALVKCYDEIRYLVYNVTKAVPHEVSVDCDVYRMEIQIGPLVVYKGWENEELADPDKCWARYVDQVAVLAKSAGLLPEKIHVLVCLDNDDGGPIVGAYLDPERAEDDRIGLAIDVPEGQYEVTEVVFDTRFGVDPVKEKKE